MRYIIVTAEQVCIRRKVAAYNSESSARGAIEYGSIVSAHWHTVAEWYRRYPPYDGEQYCFVLDMEDEL